MDALIVHKMLWQGEDERGASPEVGQGFRQDLETLTSGLQADASRSHSQR